MTEPEVVLARGIAANEHRLVQGLRAAEPEAIDALGERFGPRLHWYAAVRLGGDALLAEEVMIEVLAEGIRNIHHFDPRRSTLSAWLYGITRRKVQAELRRQGRQKSVPRTAQVPLTEAAEWAGAQDLGERTAARLEAQQQVAELAEALSDLEFEVLVLHGIEESRPARSARP